MEFESSMYTKTSQLVDWAGQNLYNGYNEQNFKNVVYSEFNKRFYCHPQRSQNQNSNRWIIIALLKDRGKGFKRWRIATIKVQGILYTSNAFVYCKYIIIISTEKKPL